MDGCGVIERFAAAITADPSSFEFDDVRSLIADLVVCRNVLDHALTRAAVRADELAAVASSGPGAEQLLRRARLSNVSAAAVASRGAVLKVLPGFAEALAAGEISGEHVDVLAPVLRDLSPDAVGVFADPLVVDGLLGVARGESPHRLRVQAREAAALVDARAGESEAQRVRRERGARFVRHRDGTVSLSVRFGAEGAEVRRVVLRDVDHRRAAQRHLAVEERCSDEQLTEDALVALIRGGAVHGGYGKPVAPAAIVQLGFQDLLDLARGGDGRVVTSDGLPLTEHEARALLADAELVPVVLDQTGLPVELARAARQRLATMIQRAVLSTMYTTCMVPGCAVPFDDCEIHHLVEFDGHNTVLSNLGPVCPHEHGEHHAGRFIISMDAQRTVTVTLPDGTIWAKQDYRPPDHVRQWPRPGAS